MAMNAHIFYVVYVTPPVLGDCLDAIRLLSRPDEKRHSHVTVRGPYRRRLARRELTDRTSGMMIEIRSADKFFGRQQSTVFLKCAAPELVRVWRKPDFPKFNPHITLYDGPLRQWASALFEVVRQYDFNVRFRASELRPIVSVGGQGSFALGLSLNAAWLSAMVEEPVTVSTVSRMSTSHRLKLIDRICKNLSGLAQKPIRWNSFSWTDWRDLTGREPYGELAGRR